MQTYGVGVCRGRYASTLVKEWHAWDKRNGSENDPVDMFGNDQLFVVFVVANGGADLEHFEVHSYEEARSIILQVPTNCPKCKSNTNWYLAPHFHYLEFYAVDNPLSIFIIVADWSILRCQLNERLHYLSMGSRQLSTLIACLSVLEMASTLFCRQL